MRSFHLHDGVHIIIEQIHRVGCLRFVALFGRYLLMSHTTTLAFATIKVDDPSFANIQEPKTQILEKITKGHVNGDPFPPTFRVLGSKP